MIPCPPAPLSHSRAWIRGAAAAIIGAAASLAGCQGSGTAPPELPELPPRPSHRQGRPPVVVIGIDGAEWRVIRDLQAEGGLPALTSLERGGISASLETAYGESPVIWTTVATGRTPAAHGITDFVVTTEAGTVPVSSAVRRVPALWNMASRAGLRVGVMGWWATWPAEKIRGIMVTDRAHLGTDRIVHPAEYLEAFLAQREAARDELPGLDGRLPSSDVWMEDGAFRDRIVAREARRLAGRGLDLLMAYFRAVDIASHRYWIAYEPESYEIRDAARIEAAARAIPAVYEATDRALGRILEALPGESNVFVLSDHGFMAGPEQPFVNLDADRLLERLGFLVRRDGAVDLARSTAWSVDSPGHARLKRVRLSLEGRDPGGSVPPEEKEETLDRLAAALESVTYASGAPLLAVRREGLPPGADLAFEVGLADPTMEVVRGGERWSGVVQYINRISGTHNEETDGIFIARGPDLDPAADAGGISIHDIAPTVLYALGLPVAEDFPGRARTDLFTREFRSAHPLRTVPTWGSMDSWSAPASPEDSRLLQELRALGYL